MVNALVTVLELLGFRRRPEEPLLRNGVETRGLFLDLLRAQEGSVRDICVFHVYNYASSRYVCIV